MSRSVSVIIPTHNRCAFLKRAVQSVLNQTHTDLQLLVIADGCTDGTEDWLESVDDDRVSYKALTESVGGAVARNIGMDMAEGDVIAFLDDDDEWLPSKIERQLSLLEEYPNTALVGCSYRLLGSGRADERIAPPSATLDDHLYTNISGSFSFCLVFRETLGNSRIHPGLDASQDWDLWVRILRKTKLPARYVSSVEATYKVGHGGRISSDMRKALESRYIFLREHWRAMNESQRQFQLYELLKMKRLVQRDKLTYTQSVRMYGRALQCYRKSDYEQHIRNYLRFVTKVLNLS